MPEIPVEEVFTPKGVRETFLEVTLGRRAFLLFYGTVLAVALLFLGRIFSLGFAQANFYEKRSLQNIDKEVVVPAARGAIFDRYGTRIVENQPVFSVSLKISEYLKNRDEIIDFLTLSIEITKEEIEAAIQKALPEESDSVIIARDVGPAELIALKAKTIAGIEIQDGL